MGCIGLAGAQALGNCQGLFSDLHKGFRTPNCWGICCLNILMWVPAPRSGAGPVGMQLLEAAPPTPTAYSLVSWSC